MRLISFRIQYIKSIIDTGTVSFGSNNILVIAGQNEAGKTALIDGLDYFHKGANNKYEKMLKRPDGATCVTCTYELTDGDIKYITENTPDKPEFYSYLETNRIIVLERSNTDTGEHVLRATTTMQSLLGKFFLKEPEEVGEKQTWPGWTAFHNILVGEVLRTQTSYDDTFSNLLPGEVRASEISEYPAVLDFQKVFAVDFAKAVTAESRSVVALENKITRDATDDLNKYWTQKLDVGAKYSFRVKVNRNPEVPMNSFIDFTVENQEGDVTPLYMEQKSKGFRWFSAFNLRLRALSVETSEAEDLLLLIDEPGEGLHEKAQLDLKVVIEELAAKGARIIYTTHNPLLIGTQGDELSRIRIAANLPKVGTKIYTLAQYSSSPSVSAQEALSPLVTAMGLHGFDQLKSNGLQNAVVEGITDMYYYLAFSKMMDYKGTYFLPSLGADNVPNIVAILMGWGQPYKALLDDDTKGRAVYKKLRNSLFTGDEELLKKKVMRVKGTHGVEDILSVNDFRKHVTKDTSKKTATLKNSQASKGSKEVLARLFHDEVIAGNITLSDLDKESKNRIKQAIDWLKIE